LKFPTVKLNSVSPVGGPPPFLYLELKPKLARPLRLGSVGYEPGGTLTQPPPVTKPADGS
jgi:hypothetical protein